MFLKLRKKALPGGANNFAFAPQDAPGHLVPLGRSLWPRDTVAAIAKVLVEAGVADPLQQKLVEPYALAFGGLDNDGVPDHNGVNW